MATRWKNKCKIKYFLWTLLCIVPAMVILSAYPHIREQSEKESRKYYTTREFAEMLYNGNQVLYEEISGANTRELDPPGNSFREIRPYLQYEVLNKNGKTILKNGESLKQLLAQDHLKKYDWIVQMEYDHLGNAEVTECYGTYAQKMKVRLSEGLYYQYEDQYEDVETAEEMGTPADCTFLYGMTKEQGQAYQSYIGNPFYAVYYGTYAQKMKVRLSEGLYYQYEDQYEDVETAEEMGTPADCTFLYGMTKEQGQAYQSYIGNPFYAVYYRSGMADMIRISIFVLIGAAIFLPFVKKLNTGNERGFQMPVEIIGITVIGLLILWEAVTSLVISTMRGDIQDRLVQLGLSNGDAESMVMAWNLIVWIIYFSLIYWVTGSIRNLISIGWKQAVRERIFLIPFLKKHRAKLEKACSFLKKKWSGLAKRVDIFFRIDLQEQSNKVIFRFVAAQFVIVSLFCMGWFFGIAGVLIYSVVLFRTICKKYYKIKQDYQRMLQATEKIASGNLDMSMEQDFGIFDPVRKQLLQIQSGFKSAVDEEVKSQKMKTELITNVSHDLKTPLTAIITYVNLLKEEGITDEERENYINVLERKSMRLKVLIEDLFEVSKATSKNVKLELAKVDIISLLKQVRLELSERMEKSELDFRWNFQEEKVYLTLDSQKTYRIFENLLINILKYSLEGTRVYIDVSDNEDIVTITMKNISKGELNFNPGDITERFVRGDVSRNTEGSGLGLAIVKSFVELQKGKLTIEVNGDLFVARIEWRRTEMEDIS